MDQAQRELLEDVVPYFWDHLSYASENLKCCAIVLDELRMNCDAYNKGRVEFSDLPKCVSAVRIAMNPSSMSNRLQEMERNALKKHQLYVQVYESRRLERAIRDTGAMVNSSILQLANSTGERLDHLIHQSTEHTLLLESLSTDQRTIFLVEKERAEKRHDEFSQELWLKLDSANESLASMRKRQ